jgi:endoglucanase
LNVHSGHLLRRATFVAGVAVVVGALGAVPLVASAAPVPSGHTLAPNTHFYVPPPAQGSTQQALQLLLHGQVKDAALIADMEATPQAVWLDGETAAQVAEGAFGAEQADVQVAQQVHQSLFAAALQHAVPVFVAYNIPGRDCGSYSAGGAPDEATYEQWIASLAAAIGKSEAVVILEPDSLGLLPSSCGVGSPTGINWGNSGGLADEPYVPGVNPDTNPDDIQRFAELTDGVTALEADPNTSVYLDGTHSAWLGVGQISLELLLADVQKAQGFFLNVSNYQPTPELTDYGTWISDCIDLTTGLSWYHPFWCPSQYYPATQNNYVPWQQNFTTWAQVTTSYQTTMASDGVGPATTHFVVDTSRNGQGPNDMSAYAGPPYNQDPSFNEAACLGGTTADCPNSVMTTLVAGNWCDPPGRGLGLTPTATTGVQLLDAYLWVKIPGQSDGQCDSAGGARAWDYSQYTQPGWPTTASAQSLFDPLWSIQTGTVFTDPAAGAWFPQQALQLAEMANPALNFPFKT